MRFRTQDLIRQERFEAAITQLKQQINVGNVGPDSFRFLGFCYFRKSEIYLSNKWLKRALLSSPEDKDSYFLLSKLPSAFSERYQNLALVIAPDSPDICFEQAIRNESRSQDQTALPNYKRALVCAPQMSDVYTNLSMLALRLDDASLARKIVKAGLYIAPTSQRLRKNSSVINLSSEHFDVGWRDYTYRRKPEFALLNPDGSPVTSWSGETIEGAAIALCGEQGIGDQFMFLSLLPDLLKRSEGVILILGDRLINIVRLAFPELTIVAESSLSTNAHLSREVDFKLALGDLPGALGLFIRPDISPSPWLDVPASLSGPYRQKLRDIFPSAKRFVGLSWKTNSVKNAEEKSIAPPLWSPLFQRQDVVFVDLQYNSTPEEVSDFSSLGPSPFFQDPELDRFNDFVGMAGMIASLDEVISIANLTPQLSGSIRTRTRVLLPKTPQWFWGRSASRSLWHPNTLIYRKSETLPIWKSVLDVVSQDLHNSP